MPLEIKDIKVIQAMQKYGGGFVKCLASAALHTDNINFNKIKTTWPEYWEQYSALANEDSAFKEGMTRLL